ncbi:MAG TPA: tRNA 2-thiouridine(34) synthase MnmA [Polyangiaceae bacterium]
MQRVLVAMSGGVDSSVAAARLVAEGHEVIGVTLHLWDYPDDGTVQGRCCAPEDVHDAARVAAQIGIAHYSFDRRQLFDSAIVQPFVDAYLSGQTPSPCVHCNRQVKLRELLSIADRLGADRVATGHYAQIVERDGRLELHRGIDRSKDQSYFLHSYLDSALKRLCFPLGGATKATIRAEAARLGLVGAEKGESQELCFVPTGRYDAFVDGRANGRIRPGKVIDEQGRELGTHEGIHRFTLGQRRNLGVAVGHRVYVTNIDADAGTVTLGERESLLSDVAMVEAVALTQDLSLPAELDCVVRYRGEHHRARVEAVGAEPTDRDPAATGQTGANPGIARLRIQFQSPVASVVAGQFAVLYAGDRVMGGGLIVPN